MIGDKVKIGLGSVEVSDVNVPVYGLHLGKDNKPQLDINGAASAYVLGGVKGGSTGKIVGPPVKVAKNTLIGFGEGASLGVDYTNMYPVQLDYYQQTAWFPQDSTHIQGEYYRS